MNIRFFNHLVMAVVAVSMMFLGCKKEETLSFDVPSDSIFIEVENPGDTGTAATTFRSHNISAIDVVSVAKGWEVVDIDLKAKTITVKSPETFDNDEVRSGNISLTAYSPMGTKESATVYVAIVNKSDEVDYYNTPANCYIACKAPARYLFNPMIGGTSTPLNTAYIEIIWQSIDGIIKYVDLQNGIGSFYIEALSQSDDADIEGFEPGNALLGAYDAEGNLIWTWHIWITQTDPEQDTITLNGATMMNRNLGADCNSAGSDDPQKIARSYGMYYQWGRHTPIVGPQSWNFAANYDMIIYDADGIDLKLKYTESTAKTGTVEWAEANPLTMIKGNKDNVYDWLFEGHDDTLWSDSSKSENDPCPAGWRLPDSSVFEGLTISGYDDDLMWQEAQKMYGWNLVDEADNNFFFSAAGRRNYLDGRLAIVNDDTIRPVPWSGYYWTATATDDGMAEAMFFDLNSATRTWNGFESARSMHRANAMPVRCIRYFL